jgi:hypothetical protein
VNRPAALGPLVASLVLLAGCGSRSTLLEAEPTLTGGAGGGSGTSTTSTGPATWPAGPAASRPVVVTPIGNPSWLGVVALGDRFGVAWVVSTGGLTAGDLWLATARRDGADLIGSAPTRVGALGMAGVARLVRIGDGLGAFFADASGSLHLARFDRDGGPLDDAPVVLASTTIAWPIAAHAEGDHVDVAWSDYRAPGAVLHRRLGLDGVPRGPEIELGGVTPLAIDYTGTLGAGVYAASDGSRTGVVTFDPLGASPPVTSLLDATWTGSLHAVSLDAAGALDVGFGGRIGARVGRWRGGAAVTERASIDTAFSVALARRPDGALAIMATDADVVDHAILWSRMTFRALGAGDGGPVGGVTAIETPPIDGGTCLVASAFDAGDTDYGVAWANQCDVDGAVRALRFALVPWR